jgi:hypothetical protein
MRSRPRWQWQPAFPRLPLPHRGVRGIHDFVRSVRDNVRRGQCDCFRRPLNDCRRITRLSIDHCLKGLNRLLQLLVRKRLQGTRVLNPHLLGNEQCTNLHIRGRLIFPHPRNGLRAAFAEIPRQCLKKCLAENVTRTLGIPAKVSRRPLRELPVLLSLDEPGWTLSERLFCRNYVPDSRWRSERRPITQDVRRGTRGATKRRWVRICRGNCRD